VDLSDHSDSRAGSYQGQLQAVTTVYIMTGLLLPRDKTDSNNKRLGSASRSLYIATSKVHMSSCFTAQVIPNILGNGPIDPALDGFTVGLASVSNFPLSLAMILFSLLVSCRYYHKFVPLYDGFQFN
jgi:hypothetical protein